MNAKDFLLDAIEKNAQNTYAMLKTVQSFNLDCSDRALLKKIKTTLEACIVEIDKMLKEEK